MSVQFAEKPSVAELASFASRANEINIGGDDIVELGDDLGMNLMANPSKMSATPTRQVSFGSGNGSGSGGPSITSEIPKIQIKPVDDLEVVNLDAAPGNNDIQLQKSADAPFVLNITKPAEPASADQEIAEKQKYLTKLRRLEAQDIRGARMTMGNSLADIKAEHDRLTDSRNLEASVRFQRNALMTFVTGVEMVNDKFGNKLPVKPRLKGWSESVHTNIEDFDDIFEELYDLYKDTAKVHPVIRLVGTLGVSATMYHLTNTMAERSGIPGMADLLHENPELQRQFAAAAAAKMGGLGNFMNAASGFAQPRAPAENTRVPFNVASAAMDEMPSVPHARREMRGPTGVDDILKAFEAERMAQPPIPTTSSVFTPSGPPPTPPLVARQVRESDPLTEFGIGSDSQSVGTDTTMNTEKRRRRRAVAPPVGATLNLNV
jgi:hypothetical protein